MASNERIDYASDESEHQNGESGHSEPNSSSLDEYSSSGSENEITLYHYTNESSAESIEKHKVIKGSTDETPKQRRRFGKGVYFTSIDPSNHPKSILLNNYDDAGQVIKSKKLWDKIEWVIEVYIPEDEVEKAQGNRDVYLYEGDVDLTLYQHEIYQNPRKTKRKNK